MEASSLFPRHLATLQERFEDTLVRLGEAKIPIEGLLIHSGSEGRYFADDMPVPFRAYGHFLHWVPVERPDQMVLLRPGCKPVFFEVMADDFWVDQRIEREPWWADAFDIVQLKKADEVMDRLPPLRRLAFLGENTAFAASLGLPSGLHNERNLQNRLDYFRGIKTPYEVARIREACETAASGHRAAREAFLQGESEWGVLNRFLQAARAMEHETPFASIVGQDDRSAILHYQLRRKESGTGNQVCLVDAGCRSHAYASDLTRTHVRDSAHPVFRELAARVKDIALTLIGEAAVGKPYGDLQERAHALTLEHLRDTGIVSSGGDEELKEKKISHLFLPHGIGHLLGIQTHDVAGLFKDETGLLAPPPEEFKTLRLTRKLEPGMVYTIEPGIYFIPMLLNPERETDKGKFLDWGLIDQLLPLGGMRYEDDILITENGPENLVRDLP